MSGRAIKPWDVVDETRLLIWSVANKPIADYARATGRSFSSVRTKLCRLRKDPALRPPTLSAATRDAAAPRVPTARGPSDTSDS